MEVFLQQLINGMTLGSIYGLIAIGYTMVFGIIGMVNFAHGDVFMVSAFIALITFLILTTWLGVTSVALALFIVLVVAMVLTSLRQLDDRAPRLPAAARLVPPGAADLGDRHVDLPVEFRPGQRRARATSRCRRWCSGEFVLMDGDGYRRHAVLQADHHLGRHRRAAGGVLVSW